MLVQFVGGIGDTLLKVFQSDDYTFLENIGPEERIHVDFVVGNPRLQELLEWHPKREQLILSTHDLEFPIDAPILKKWGLPTDHRPYISYGVRPRPEVVAGVRWYVSQNDESVLEEFCRPPYIAFCCSAGHTSRNIPSKICAEAATICNRLGIRIVQLGATYHITSPLMAHRREDLPLPEGVQFTNLIDRLSIPGSLRAVDGAAAVFTCHSSPVIQAWFRRKPSYMMYPDSMQPEFLTSGTVGRFLFGILDPEHRASMFTKWSAVSFEDWLRESVGVNP